MKINLQNAKRAISVIICVSICLSMASLSTFAADETVAKDAFSTIKAYDYVSEKTNITTAGFDDNKAAMSAGGYLSYVSGGDYAGYNLNFSKSANLMIINYSSLYCPDWAVEQARVYIDEVPDKTTLKPGYIASFVDDLTNKADNKTMSVKLSSPISSGNHTVYIQFPGAGTTLYDFTFKSTMDTKDYIKAVDYDYTDKSSADADYANFLECKNNGYLGYNSYRKFEYDCYFDEVPNYVELDIKRTATNDGEMCLSLDAESYQAPLKIAVLDKDAINSCTINNRVKVILPIDENCKIDAGTYRRLVVKMQSAPFYLYGLRFMKTRDAFNKIRATDVDIWPEKGSIYKTPSDSASGFTDNFKNSLAEGCLNYCAGTTFTYDCYFDKIPDYVEIEVDGTYANSTIGIGFVGNPYALVNISKETLNSQNVKGKICIPLTAETKAKIKANSAQSIAMRTDAGGVKVYSLKFSSEKEVFYDPDNQTVCIYGNLSTNTEAPENFVAIGGVYENSMLSYVKYDTVSKNSMKELDFTGKAKSNIKVFQWSDLSECKPLAEPYSFNE